MALQLLTYFAVVPRMCWPWLVVQSDSDMGAAASPALALHPAAAVISRTSPGQSHYATVAGHTVLLPSSMVEGCHSEGHPAPRPALTDEHQAVV